MITLKPLFIYAASKRWSKKELSEKTGIPYSTIRKMRNENTFTTKQIDKVCKELNLTIDQVIRYEESD